MDSPYTTKHGRRRDRYSPRRLFTLEQANRTLPLVRRIVADIVNQYKSVSDLQARSTHPPAGLSAERRRALKDECARAVDRLREFAEELSAIGCELKDWQRGLVDFPCEHDGRKVYLCWQLGDETIAFWHELDAGYSGRQPIGVTF